MAVYVDDWRQPAPRGSAVCRSSWSSDRSNLFADSIFELEAIANRLNLPFGAVRVGPAGRWCEVSQGVRVQAVRLGAIPLRVGSAGWVSVVRHSRLQQRASGPLDLPGRWAA